MTRHRATVVITGSGTVTCQSVIKALRAQDEIRVQIVTLDASDQVAGRYFSDHFHTIPPARHPRFVDAVLDACRRHSADLLIPIVDYEFQALSQSRQRFEDIGCTLAISPPSVIELVNDKLCTYRFFLDHGFNTAKTWTGPEAAAARDQLPYPLFLKPAVDGRSSLDCHRIDSPSELDRRLEEVPEAMVQELIDAPEFTVDLLADWDSAVLGMVVRERLETKGGVSYKGRTVRVPELEQQVIRMVRLLGIQGPANIQAFRRQAEILFNEINPRFSGALALSLAAGMNSPLMLTKLALGLPVASVLGGTRVGLTMLRYWSEVFVDPVRGAQFPDYALEPAIHGFDSTVSQPVVAAG